uniref:Uncharacterized protein n=1 Tax=Anguilla anguilla TaxID=7936 RepID=A0A0E9WRQ3_ANGAN
MFGIRLTGAQTTKSQLLFERNTFVCKSQYAETNERARKVTFSMDVLIGSLCCLSDKATVTYVLPSDFVFSLTMIYGNWQMEF